MKVRATDAKGDMVFGAPGASGWLVDSPQAVGSLVLWALRLWRGEWFLDTTRGLPVFQELFARGATEGVIADILRAEILKVPGVKSIDTLAVAIDRTNRVAKASINVVTTYGKAQVQL